MNYEILAKIVAPIITAIVGAIVKKYTESKPKLVAYIVNATGVPVTHNGNAFAVNTHSLVIRNSGRKAAKNVRIGHNYLPEAYQIFPNVYHEVSRPPNSRMGEIVIPTLVPNEQVTISYLYYHPDLVTGVNSYCKSDEVLADYINAIPVKPPSKLIIYIANILMFIGASTLVYGVFWLVFYYLGLLSS